MKNVLPCLLVLSVACGTAHDGVASDAAMPEPIAEADWHAASVAADVALADRCCKEIGSPGVSDAYEADVEAGYASYAVLPDAGATYDEAMASACIAQSKQGPCAPFKAGSPLGFDVACDNVYMRGTRKLGEPCRSFYDCAKDHGQVTTCITTSTRREADGGLASTRICVRYVEVGEGERCAGLTTDAEVQCKRGLLCDPKLEKCVKPAARGEPCITGAVYGDTCAAGSVCDRDHSKRCIEPPAIGDACGPGLPECEGLACYGGKCREALFVTSNPGACQL